MTDKAHTAVIVGYVRSPFTPANKGELRDVRPDDLAAQVVLGLIKKVGVDPALIGDLKLGCAMPEGEQGYNMARNIVFLAGLPQKMAGVTINRFCGSSMQAVHDAVGAISAGMADAVICAGVESMSRVPMGGYNIMPNAQLVKEYPAAYTTTGQSAENTAAQFHVSREEQEAYAVESQRKATKAAKEKEFRDEIVAITTPSGRLVTEDGCIRPGTTMEGLAKLKPAFGEAGTVTAGTSSPLTDGAAAVLIVSEEFAEKHGLPILARVKSFAVAGVEADTLMGPVKALEKALKKAGLSAGDIDLLELHEAFASQSVACLREMGIADEKVNKHGGALALGHPLGASGARNIGKAAQLLHREGGHYAASAMCIAGGQGIATILENPDAGKPEPAASAPVAETKEEPKKKSRISRLLRR